LEETCFAIFSNPYFSYGEYETGADGKIISGLLLRRTKVPVGRSSITPTPLHPAKRIKTASKCPSGEAQDHSEARRTNLI
jgi:hypothetical protein